MESKNQPFGKEQKGKARKWMLRKGEVLVVEDACTASLVIVARELKSLGDRIDVLEEVLGKFNTQAVHP